MVRYPFTNCKGAIDNIGTPVIINNQHTIIMSYNSRNNNIKGASPPISYYFLPRQRLNTLLLIHSFASFIIGGSGYLNPSFAQLFFSLESSREKGVGRILTRLFCSLIFAQGIMIWSARQINDPEIKRAFIKSYFICFLMSSLALIYEHLSNQGIVEGSFFWCTQDYCNVSSNGSIWMVYILTTTDGIFFVGW